MVLARKKHSRPASRRKYLVHALRVPPELLAAIDAKVAEVVPPVSRNFYLEALIRDCLPGYQLLGSKVR